MANINISQILIKRGNTIAANTYVGPLGELLVDTGLKTLRLQDGATPGGMSILATQRDLGNVAAAIAGINSVGNISQILANLQSANVTAISANVTTLQANAAYQAVLIANLQSNVSHFNYTNSNVASYLPTYTGNLKANQINFVNGGQISTGHTGGDGGTGFAITANVNNDINGIYIQEGVDSYAQIYTQGAIFLYTNTSGATPTWKFGTEGNMTFPDNTVQATAYQGPAGQTSFTTTTYVSDAITTAVHNLINSAPGTLDTLGEIAANLAGEAGSIGSIITSITNTNANVNNVSNSVVTANTAMKSYVDAVTTAWTANAITQLSQITAANTQIAILQANVGAFEIFSSANAGGLYNSILGANATIATLQANVGAFEIFSNANTAGLNNSIVAANAAIVTANTAMKSYVDAVTTAWTANAATQQGQIATINANVTAANATIVAVQASVTAANATIGIVQANIGGFYTWANTNFITSIYSNSNVAAYLPTYSGNIAAFSIKPTGNTTTGFNGVYIGVQSGYALVPSLAAQFTANYNSYSQINSQNISNGNQSTTDYVATANNGTNTINFIDMGIAGNTYDGTQPNNSLGTSLYPNDGYVYVQGNTAGVVGGNLVLGTTTPGTGIRFLAGGINSSNVAVAINNPGTNPVNNATGALVVTGGVGISGNINVGQYNTSLHNIRGNILLGLGNVVASADSILTINQNPSTPTVAPNNVVHMSALDGRSAQYGADAFGVSAAGGVYIRKARGTSFSPSAVQSGDQIGFVAARGFGTANFANAAITSPSSIGIYAAENYTDTSQGTSVNIRVIPIGSNSAVTAVSILSNTTTISSDLAVSGNINAGVYNTSLHNIKGNILLGLGNVVASADSTLTINQNSATPLVAPNNVVHVSAVDGKSAQYGADSFGAGAVSSIYLRKARGTSASPTAVQSGDYIGTFAARGYGATGFPSTASSLIGFYATENYTDVAQGTGITLKTTPLGSNSAVTTATFTTNAVTISSNLNVGTYDYSVHNIKGNVLFGIGNVVASADSTITINQNTTTPAFAPNNVVHMSALDGKSAQYGADSYGAGAVSGVYLRKARGTSASPSAIQSGDYIGTFAARGYGATGYAQTPSSLIGFYATENFTDTAQGTAINLKTVPNGAVIATSVATFTTNAVTILSNLNVGIYDYSIHNIKGNILFGIGNVVASSDSTITINQNTSTPLFAPNNVVHMSALDGKSAQYGADAFGVSATAGFYARKARGSSASPSAVQSGDYVGTFAARGYGATTFSTSGVAPLIGFYALENFTDSSQGMGLVVRTTPIGANTAGAVATFTSNLTTITSNLGIDSGSVTIYDSILDLHTYANAAAWSSDDGKDIGVRMHYYNGVDSLAFMGLENSSKSLQFLINATEVSGNVTGTFGNAQLGSLLLSNTTASTGTTTGALIVAGGAGVAGNLNVGGNVFQQGAYYETYSNVSNTGGNLTLNFVNGGVYYATLTANTTVNVVGLSNTAFTTTGFTVIVDQGATPYHIANIQFNGGSVTNVKWAGATVPTGTASNTDVISISLINLNNGNYRILGQQSSYA